MGFGEMRLIAANTAGASAADPASTATTPSSPTCTPMFAPAPAITKKEGRTSRISRLFDGPAATCDAAPLEIRGRLQVSGKVPHRLPPRQLSARGGTNLA